MFSECQKTLKASNHEVHMFHTRYFCLRVTFSNQYDLVPHNKVIFIQLLYEYPSDANNSFIFCPGHKFQCYLPFNLTEFILLCNHPIRIHQSFFNFLRFFLKQKPKNLTFILSSSHSHPSVRISKNQESRMVFTPYS